MHWLVLFIIINHQSVVRNHLKSKLVHLLLKISGPMLVLKCCLEFPVFDQILQERSKVRSVPSPTQTPPPPAPW